MKLYLVGFEKDGQRHFVTRRSGGFSVMEHCHIFTKADAERCRKEYAAMPGVTAAYVVELGGKS